MLVGQSKVSGCPEPFCEVESFSYLVAGFAAGVVMGAPLGTLRPSERWVNHSLSPEAGFPEPKLRRSKAIIILIPVALLAAVLAM